MDRGATAVTTDATGHYVMENAYPMTQWLVMEAYDDLHYTTGVTYQADNQPTPDHASSAPAWTSACCPSSASAGRMDWGKHAYDPTGANGVDPRNGGIVGTVSYDTTRNELDPRYAAAEDWQPGISDLTDEAVRAGGLRGPTPALPCDASGRYELGADGSYAKGPLLNTYVTETWQRPNGLRGPRRRRRPARCTAPTSRCSRWIRTRTASKGRSWASSSAPMPTTRERPTRTSAPPWTATTGSATAASTGTLDATDSGATPSARRRPTFARRSRRARLPGRGGDPERRHRPPALQGDPRGGHQHRQRRPVRPAGAAAGLRRPAPHGGRRPAYGPTASRR